MQLHADVASPGHQSREGQRRALIADAHGCVRDLVEVALRLDGSCRVVGHAGRGGDLLALCQSCQPEVLIVDPRLPDLCGAELVRQVRALHPALRVLVFSGSGSREMIRGVIEAHPHGFVHKEEPLGVFYEVLRAVVRGARCFSEYGVRLMDRAHESGRGLAEALTPRETLVLTLLASGRSNKQIGHELHISVKTVDHHRTSLMAKLGIHEVAGLTRYAVSAGLVAVEA